MTTTKLEGLAVTTQKTFGLVYMTKVTSQDTGSLWSVPDINRRQYSALISRRIAHDIIEILFP
jgi:hypothetical protein